MKVLILQGLPGSGKSTYAKNTAVNRLLQEDSEAYDTAISADDFFVRKGVYQFDPTKLPEAHAYSLRTYLHTLMEPQYQDDRIVFVDNTNTTVAEVAPYYALAQAYGWDVGIIHFPCDPETAAQRNTHGVSLDTCKAMAARLEKFEEQMPPWWLRCSVTEFQMPPWWMRRRSTK